MTVQTVNSDVPTLFSYTPDHYALYEKLLQRLVIRGAKVWSKYGPYNSAHEADGVMQEEIREWWKELDKKEVDRDPDMMIDELIDVACCAMKAALSIQVGFKRLPEAP